MIPQEIIEEIIKKYEPSKIILFGSFITTRNYRDIDILVETNIAKRGKDMELSKRLKQIYGEKYDITITYNAQSFIEKLEIINYHILH